MNVQTPAGLTRHDRQVKWFADPYKRCLKCKRWVDGAADVPGSPLTLVPCGHESNYEDVCPSWGPVDGCGCARYNAITPSNAPIVHDMRDPNPDDGKTY